MMSSSSVRLKIFGAAQTVTGSKYLLEAGGKSILVDCGLFQGRKELRLLNWQAPLFATSTLDAIVLTHAHIDHSGFLPVLVRRGYRGPIYCTKATAELLKLLLPDSAHLQEEEARYSNRVRSTKHTPATPLYTAEDAEAALKLVRPTLSAGETFELFPNITVQAACAGHILGSVSLAFSAYGKRITFSGDIGRYDSPLLPDPAPADLGDVLLCESTYGDRSHGSADIELELQTVVKKAIERRGPLIIPAFAVGRTQTLLYYFAKLEREGKIPHLPIYVDSPMAINATEIYNEFNHDFDSEAAKLIARGDLPMTPQNLNFCRTVEDSKRLNSTSGTTVIISASGMINGGRILHHMVNWLPRREATVLFVGYQAIGTRGRLIESGIKEIKIFGAMIPVSAQVETISGLSAHGDGDELIRWLKSCNGTPRAVRLIHGEPESLRVFSARIQKELGWNARPAEYLEEIEV